MITAKYIPWEPIGTMPDDRKDGRPMLLWSHLNAPRVGVWDATDYFGEPFGWCDSEEAGARIDPTHWADINPPAPRHRGG